MQKELIQFIACIAITTGSFQQPANAQSSNPCSESITWGDWKEFSNDCPIAPCGASIRFKNGACTNSGNVCGVGLQWQYHNNVLVKDAYYEITIQYKTCGGTTASMKISMDLDHTGTWTTSGNYTNDGGVELLNMQYRLINPNKDKASQIKDDVNDSIKSYNLQYADAMAAANKIKDAAKHSQFIQQINANKDAFHQLDLLAQDQINEGDGVALAQTLDQMKQQQNDLHTIYLRIDPDGPSTVNTQGNTTIISNNTVQASQYQSTTNNNANTQQQAIQQQITQGQQQMQQQTNEKIQNSVQQGTEALTNYADFIANENEKKAEGQALYEERMDRINGYNREQSAKREALTFTKLNADAEKGDPKAMAALGKMYCDGNNSVQKDMKKAEYWYKKAAEQGDTSAQAFLCKLYDYYGGTGVIDHDQAIFWCEKAALKGYTDCKEYDVPEYLLSGLYAEKARKYFEKNDLEQATLFYRKDFAIGSRPYTNQDAENIAKLVLQNKLTQQEVIDATKNNFTSLQKFYFSMANSYQYGESVSVDSEQARLYYGKVIDLRKNPQFENYKKSDLELLAAKRIKELKKIK
ncbi:MAG: tetratricopeptide repeat protein [Chitinophagales bacterium]